MMRHHWLHLLGSAALTAALIWAVFAEKDLKDFFLLISGVSRKAIIIYFFIAIIALLSRSLRYQIILQSTMPNAPSLSKFMVVTALRNALVDFLPARLGELSFFYVLSCYQVPLLNSLTTFGVCLALDLIVLFVLMSSFVIFAPVILDQQTVLHHALSAFGLEGKLAHSLALLVIVSLALIFLFAKLESLFRYFAFLMERKLVKSIFSERLELLRARITEQFSTAADQIKSLNQSGHYIELILMTFVVRAAKYGALYLLLLSTITQYGIAYTQINPILTTIAFIAAEASASLPFSGLLGFGLYEGVWATIFSISEVKIPSIISVILVVHLITQVMAYFFALVGLVAFLLSTSQSRKQAFGGWIRKKKLEQVES